jgi:hypothetical protein
MERILERYADLELRRDRETARAAADPAADSAADPGADCAADPGADPEATPTGAELPRTHAQRRFDALYEIFRIAGLVLDGHQRPSGSPAEPLVNLVVDATTFAEALRRCFGEDVDPVDPANVRTRRCETDRGVSVDPLDAVLAAALGRVRRVVLDADGRVTEVGRAQRLFRGALRDAVLLQHHRCCWPGCTVPASRCQADHLTEWRRGGRTAADNGGPLCDTHNLFKSRHGYTIRRDPGGRYRTFRPDGSELGPGP